VQLRAARVYRADGKIDEAVESGEGPADNPAIAMYTSSRTFYVHFPRLNAGDVVELRYRVEDVGQRNEFSDYFGEIVYLQGLQPIYGSEYVLRTPKSRSFYFHTSPLAGLTRTESMEGDSRVYTFRASEVTPLLPEPTMPPLGELLGHIHVSTYKTWDDLAAWYAGLSKDQLIPDEEVRRRVAALTKGLSDPVAKMRAIYGEVVQRTRYVALEFGIWLQATAVRAHLRSRLGRLQRQGGADRDHAREAGIPALDGAGSHGNARQFGVRAGQPRTVRPCHRLRALDESFSRRHRRVHGLDRAARVRSRGPGADRRRDRQGQAHPPARFRCRRHPPDEAHRCHAFA
jgi:hypothetical protein